MTLSFRVMRADDPFRDRYARGTRSMTASEIRALFAVASPSERAANGEQGEMYCSPVG